MPFSDADQKLIAEALTERLAGKLPTCSACGQTTWSLVPTGFIPLHMSTKTLGRDVMPCVALLCGTCGHTMLFNLFTLGVWEKLSVAGAVVVPPEREAK